MAKAQENTPAAHKRLTVWLFLSLALALGLGALHLNEAGFDWAQRVAAVREWLFEAPPVSEAQPISKPAKPVLSANLPPSFDLAYVDEAGKLIVAGRGEAGWTVRLQNDSAVAGEASADENGEWVITPERPLSPGDHTLSLIESGPAGEAVPGPRKVTLSVAPRHEASPVAEPVKQAGLQQMAVAPKAEQVAVAPKANAAPSVTETSLPSPPGSKDCAVAVVKPGDTLWEMAHRCYGNGTNYAKIYQSNQPLLRDPNLIYPDQQLKMPH